MDIFLSILVVRHVILLFVYYTAPLVQSPRMCNVTLCDLMQVYCYDVQNAGFTHCLCTCVAFSVCMTVCVKIENASIKSNL